MYIKVKATPASKKVFFEKKSDDTFSIHVKEPAERNLANKKIIILIAEYFNVPTGKVRIISGHRSRSKILSLEIE